LEFSNAPASVQVVDGEGKLLPTQLLSTDGSKVHFLFLAQMPPLGFAVFSVKGSAAAVDDPPASLKVSEHSLENAHYRITLNDLGDIAGIFDKVAKRELLSAPARLQFLTQDPSNNPAWSMAWRDQTNTPRSYLGGPAKIRIVENGPVRIAVEIERTAENSIVKQTIRLADRGAGDRVEIANSIDWQSSECSLKADFPLTVANTLATYNWDMGKVERGNNDPKKYEVPSHQWFDLTDRSGDYGVSILSPDKYGSDKPADNDLRLTLLFTPGVKYSKRFKEQKSQDWGRHDFIYGIYGHAGGWRDAKTDWQSSRLSQPLLAFSTTPHDGKLGKSFSLLQLNSDQIAVRAVKLAEKGDAVIVRLQELNGKRARGVNLTAATNIESAIEVSGIEKPLSPLKPSEGKLKMSFTAYQLRSLALTFKSPGKLSLPNSVPLELPYNLNVFSTRGVANHGDFDGAGSTIPAEMIGDEVISEGIPFRIGPHNRNDQNAVSCQGQTILLPAGGFNELYLLAATANGDNDGTFTIDGQPTTLHIQNWTGYIGQWDNRIFEGTVPEMTYSVTNSLVGITTGFIKRDPLAWFCSHRRLSDGSDAIYSYSYLFKYHIPLPPGAGVLTLPNNPNIRIVAATVSKNENDDTQPALPLYDDFTGRKSIVLRPDLGVTAGN
jgi:alpha-mannosidase